MSKVHSQSSLGNLVGEEFGPYRLVRRLGVGGMAETYEAIRRGPSGFTQHVCLKLVLPFFRDNEDFVRLFEREARLAAKLRHSNIVGVIDFGAIDGTPYMALELVDGADLRVLLDAQDGRRLSHELVALLGHEVAAGLEHAHAPRSGRSADGSAIDAIVHRDVSPSNVLISRHGETLLSDFGVAKAISGTSRNQSAVKGKVPYMSPEQLRAEPLDGRADLFALGVVLFEALAGRRPYEGAHDPATIMLTLAGDHPSLRGLAPDAPSGLCDVIESLLEPDRDDRPGSASALIDLLDEFVPSPRARRELGKMVDECSPTGDRISTEDAFAITGGVTAADSVSGEGGTGVQRTGGASAAADTTELGSRGRGSGSGSRRAFGRMLAGALLTVGVVTAGAVALWPEEQGPERSVEGDGNESAPPAVAGEDTSTSADDAEDKTGTVPSEADDDTVPPAAGSPRPARLTVIVFPWGNVWINGKPHGSAPLKSKRLKPGRYEISVGQEGPFKTQTIRLRPGQRKTLDFDLTK